MITEERYKAITRHAIEGKPLGANKEELQEMVVRLSKSVVIAANAANLKQGFQSEMPVTWLKKDEVLAIGQAIINMQVMAAQGVKPEKEDHDACNDAIRLLKPKTG